MKNILMAVGYVLYKRWKTLIAVIVASPFLVLIFLGLFMSIRACNIEHNPAFKQECVTLCQEKGYTHSKVLPVFGGNTDYRCFCSPGLEITP